MKKDKLFKFADKYCYLDDADKPQKVFNHNMIDDCIQEILSNPEFKPGKTGTIISFALIQNLLKVHFLLRR